MFIVDSASESARLGIPVFPTLRHLESWALAVYAFTGFAWLPIFIDHISSGFPSFSRSL